ncbi:TetR family transcriptional regulator [Lacticaseibacillus sp. GG6-2]
MVSTTFRNLDKAKQQRVEAALLKEFSAYPVATAQVARIVREAGIARGAFYKYFDDIEDAYGYLFHQVMVAVHSHLPRFENAYQATAAFVTGAQDSDYLPFLRQHFLHNEGILTAAEPPVADDPKAWAIKVLCHETIRAALVDPESAQARLDQLHQVLKQLA